jgi:hypothetical protein
MIAFRPVPLKLRMGQSTLPQGPASVVGQSATAVPRFAIDEGWDIGSILMGAAVLGITGMAAYTGIKLGLKETDNTQKTFDYVFGVGSALLAILYLGGRLNAGYPALRITKN